MTLINEHYDHRKVNACVSIKLAMLRRINDKNRERLGKDLARLTGTMTVMEYTNYKRRVE